MIKHEKIERKMRATKFEKITSTRTGELIWVFMKASGAIEGRFIEGRIDGPPSGTFNAILIDGDWYWQIKKD